MKLVGVSMVLGEASWCERYVISLSVALAGWFVEWLCVCV